jgi:hypothetical protein
MDVAQTTNLGVREQKGPVVGRCGLRVYRTVGTCLRWRVTQLDVEVPRARIGGRVVHGPTGS